MGLQSHASLQQDRADVGRPPGSAPRLCTGLRWIPPGSRQSWGAEPVGPEGAWVECSSGATAWAPEVSFCSHHLPEEWIPVINARLRLYAALCRDVWADVLAEYPAPST